MALVAEVDEEAEESRYENAKRTATSTSYFHSNLPHFAVFALAPSRFAVYRRHSILPSLALRIISAFSCTFYSLGERARDQRNTGEIKFGDPRRRSSFLHPPPTLGCALASGERLRIGSLALCTPRGMRTAAVRPRSSPLNTRRRRKGD